MKSLILLVIFCSFVLCQSKCVNEDQKQAKTIHDQVEVHINASRIVKQFEHFWVNCTLNKTVNNLCFIRKAQDYGLKLSKLKLILTKYFQSSRST